MNNSKIDYIYNGNKVFQVPFSFNDKNIVKVYVNSIQRDFLFIRKNYILVNGELNNGDVIAIRRESEIKNETEFNDYETFDSSKINNINNNFLNNIQENYENNIDALKSNSENSVFKQFDMNYYNIKNIGNPVNENDAVNFNITKDKINEIENNFILKENIGDTILSSVDLKISEKKIEKEFSSEIYKYFTYKGCFFYLKDTGENFFIIGEKDGVIFLEKRIYGIDYNLINNIIRLKVNHDTGEVYCFFTCKNNSFNYFLNFIIKKDFSLSDFIITKDYDLMDELFFANNIFYCAKINNDGYDYYKIENNELFFLNNVYRGKGIGDLFTYNFERLYRDDYYYYYYDIENNNVIRYDNNLNSVIYKENLIKNEYVLNNANITHAIYDNKHNRLLFRNYYDIDNTKGFMLYTDNQDFLYEINIHIVSHSWYDKNNDAILSYGLYSNSIFLLDNELTKIVLNKEYNTNYVRCLFVNNEKNYIICENYYVGNKYNIFKINKNLYNNEKYLNRSTDIILNKNDYNDIYNIYNDSTKRLVSLNYFDASKRFYNNFETFEEETDIAVKKINGILYKYTVYLDENFGIYNLYIKDSNNNILNTINLNNINYSRLTFGDIFILDDDYKKINILLSDNFGEKIFLVNYNLNINNEENILLNINLSNENFSIPAILDQYRILGDEIFIRSGNKKQIIILNKNDLTYKIINFETSGLNLTQNDYNATSLFYKYSSSVVKEDGYYYFLFNDTITSNYLSNNLKTKIIRVKEDLSLYEIYFEKNLYNKMFLENYDNTTYIRYFDIKYKKMFFYNKRLTAVYNWINDEVKVKLFNFYDSDPGYITYKNVTGIIKKNQYILFAETKYKSSYPNFETSLNMYDLQNEDFIMLDYKTDNPTGNEMYEIVSKGDVFNIDFIKYVDYNYETMGTDYTVYYDTVDDFKYFEYIEDDYFLINKIETNLEDTNIKYFTKVK